MVGSCQHGKMLTIPLTAYGCNQNRSPSIKASENVAGYLRSVHTTHIKGATSPSLDTSCNVTHAGDYAWWVYFIVNRQEINLYVPSFLIVCLLALLIYPISVLNHCAAIIAFDDSCEWLCPQGGILWFNASAKTCLLRVVDIFFKNAGFCSNTYSVYPYTTKQFGLFWRWKTDNTHTQFWNRLKVCECRVTAWCSCIM